MSFFHVCNINLFWPSTSTTYSFLLLNLILLTQRLLFMAKRRYFQIFLSVGSFSWLRATLRGSTSSFSGSVAAFPGSTPVVFGSAATFRIRRPPVRARRRLFLTLRRICLSRRRLFAAYRRHCLTRRRFSPSSATFLDQRRLFKWYLSTLTNTCNGIKNVQINRQKYFYLIYKIADIGD